MKKNVLFIFASVCAALTVHSQTTATFENLTLSPDTYYDGSANPDGTIFNSGNSEFENYYDSDWSYWASGWAYSNMKDSVTPGYSNLFSARTAVGNNNSANYAIGQQAAVIKFNSTAEGKVVNGFYVTNSTYAALSMQDGDSFAKKFGGTSGDDPDWFKLTVKKWLGGVMTNDSVVFYLADYRFTDNSQDYIVTDWQYVDLTSLGNVDSLSFFLTSTDNGSFGMNTPAFFCIDDFTTADSPLSVAENKNGNFEIYPNPATNFLKIKNENSEYIQISVSDINGRIISEFTTAEKLYTYDFGNEKPGVYLLNILSESNFSSYKIIKN